MGVYRSVIRRANALKMTAQKPALNYKAHSPKKKRATRKKNKPAE